MKVTKEDLDVTIGLLNESDPYGSCSPLHFIERMMLFAYNNLMKKGNLLSRTNKVLGVNIPRTWLIVKAGWFMINLVRDIVRCFKMSHASEFRVLTFNNIEYFDSSEFDSPDKKGSGKNMNMEFMRKLSTARAIAGIPFKINSGYRTKSHNSRLRNASPNSSHLKGYAADISCTNSRDRYMIITALQRVGFNRIGIASTFIHVDNDPDKPPYVIWEY